ncbi:hypothetical protein B1987_19810 [Mycobacterium kansasii]|nr:hypothetical protein B1987_19810 [Mycobacterium kansasii]
MASRAARAAETGTDGNAVMSSSDPRFSFSGGSGGGAGRAGGAMRADTARGVTAAGALPAGPSGARPVAAREPAVDAALCPALGPAPADAAGATAPLDIPRAAAGIPPAAAGDIGCDEDPSSPCDGPDGAAGCADGTDGASVAAAGFT